MRCSRAQGFTLIEVMAALVIVSLGMLAVIQAVSETANNGAYLRDKSVAHWVAMNRITEFRLAQQPPAVGESSGEVEMAGRRWRWNAEISQTALPSMKRIDVAVSAIESGAESPNRLASVTGFFGEKIAPAGSMPVSFDAPPPDSGQSGGSSSGSSSGGSSSSSGSGSSSGTQPSTGGGS
jgi:general secretion pathway protein I